jgi:hypothetical protein
VTDGQTPCTCQRKEGQPDTEHTGVKLYYYRGVQRKTRKFTQQAAVKARCEINKKHSAFSLLNLHNRKEVEQ